MLLSTPIARCVSADKLPETAPRIERLREDSITSARERSEKILLARLLSCPWARTDSAEIPPDVTIMDAFNDASEAEAREISICSAAKARERSLLTLVPKLASIPVARVVSDVTLVEVERMEEAREDS